MIVDVNGNLRLNYPTGYQVVENLPLLKKVIHHSPGLIMLTQNQQLAYRSTKLISNRVETNRVDWYTVIDTEKPVNDQLVFDHLVINIAHHYNTKNSHGFVVLLANGQLYECGVEDGMIKIIKLLHSNVNRIFSCERGYRLEYITTFNGECYTFDDFETDLSVILGKKIVKCRSSILITDDECAYSHHYNNEFKLISEDVVDAVDNIGSYLISRTGVVHEYDMYYPKILNMITLPNGARFRRFVHDVPHYYYNGLVCEDIDGNLYELYKSKSIRIEFNFKIYGYQE